MGFISVTITSHTNTKFYIEAFWKEKKGLFLKIDDSYTWYLNLREKAIRVLNSKSGRSASRFFKYSAHKIIKIYCIHHRVDFISYIQRYLLLSEHM